MSYNLQQIVIASRAEVMRANSQQPTANSQQPTAKVRRNFKLEVNTFNSNHSNFQRLAFSLFIAVFSVFHSYHITAQHSTMVMANPFNANGYLILKKTNPGITYFKIFVNKINFDTNGERITETMDRVEIWDVNFWKFPTAYFSTTNAYMVSLHIQGMHPTLGVLDEDDIDLPGECGDCPTGDFSGYECEANNYSLQITESWYDGQVHYSVDSKPDSYMWFTMEQYYDMSNTYIVAPGYDVVNTTIFGQVGQINIPNDPSGPGGEIHRRADGTFIPSTFPFVCGLPKLKWPWGGGNGVSGEYGGSSCSGDIGAAMYNISGASDWPYSALYCNEMAELDFGGGDDEDDDGNSGGGGDAGDELYDLLLDWDLEEESNDNDEDGDHDFWDVMVHTLSVLEEVSGNSVYTLSQIDYLDLTKYTAGGLVPSRQFHRSDLVDSSGNPTPPTFTLTQEMYRVSFTVNSGQLFQFYLPIRAITTNDFSLSSYANLTAFPVPVQGNSFDIHLTTTAHLDINCKVLDMTGNVYYTNKFLVNAGHNENHHLELSNNTPYGILIVQLQFTDGSYKTLTITKAQ